MTGHWRALAASLALAAAVAPSVASAQDDGFSEQAQRLASCAGAVAAQGGLNVLTYPEGVAEGSEWAPLLGAILGRLNVEPGLEGMTGRYAASSAREFWAGQSARRREAAANRCRTSFGGAG